MNKRQPLIFFSHHHSEATLLTPVVNILELYGFNCFLAHLHISPSKNWKHTILENLKNCDFFIPFLSNEFKSSPWCDQESGIAYEKNKVIIPIIVTLEPYGFLYEIQGISYKSNQANLPNAILDAIETGSFSLRFHLIQHLKFSDSFQQSNLIISRIRKYSRFSITELESILNAIFKNQQVNEAFETKKLIKKIIVQNSHDISEYQKNKLLNIEKSI